MRDRSFGQLFAPPRRGGKGAASERPRQVASTADAVLSVIDHNPIYMVGTEAGELRMLEDAQRTLEQRIRN